MTIDWNKQPLGAESDRAIAKRLRVNSSTVTRERNRRGIPALVRVSGPGLVRGIDWDAQPLATTPPLCSQSVLAFVARRSMKRQRRAGSNARL